MNRHIRIFFLVLAISLQGSTYAQTTKADSLENLLKTHLTEDTIRVNLLNETGNTIFRIDADKAFDYANKAAELSDKINFPKGKAKSFWVIGNSLSYNKSEKQALEYYLKALKIAENTNEKSGISNYLYACGAKYGAIGNIIVAAEYYRKSMSIAEQLNDQNLIIKCRGSLAMNSSGKGDYDKALEEYQEILRILDKNEDKTVRSRTLNNIGEINKFQGNYPQALEYYLKSLKYKEETNNETSLALVLTNIGGIYTFLGDYDNAFKYVNRALKIAEKLNDKRQTSLCYEELGNIYFQTNKPEALGYFQKALTIAEELSFQSSILNVSIRIGELYLAKRNFKEALDYYSKALKIAEALKRKRKICETCIKIGDLYLLQKEYGKALSYSQRSLAFARELKLVGNQKDIHHQLSEIYAATNQYKLAYQHANKYKELNDSIFNEKNTKKLTELEYTYKFEKEKQAIELRQQKAEAVHQASMLSLISGFVLVLLFLLFVFRSSRIKHRINLVLLKQKEVIEKLNEEYLVINDELMGSNAALVQAKILVEASEEKLMLLIKNSNDILVLVNEKGEQTFVSDAVRNLTGFDSKDLLGSVEDVIFPEDIAIIRQHWARVMANKEVADIVQYRHKHKEKGYVWFETVAQNFLDNPAIRSVVANVRDISERKKTELALQEIEKTKAALLQREILRINEELEENQKSMAAATLRLIHNSERDARIIERLKEIERDTALPGKKKIQELIAENKRVSFNSNWDEFEILFEKVHRSFYEKLNTQYQTLTVNERKLSAFLKLNMSNKEIAQITFQSEEALKKARLRLRQKLEIDRETNLAAFLQNF